MEVSFRTLGNILLVMIDGEIDHHTSSYLREKIDNKIIIAPIKNIIFDFSSVKFMDSSGIGMIIGRYNRISRLGGRMMIANPNEHIRKILEMSGIPKIIPIRNDEGQNAGTIKNL